MDAPDAPPAHDAPQQPQQSYRRSYSYLTFAPGFASPHNRPALYSDSTSGSTSPSYAGIPVDSSRAALIASYARERREENSEMGAVKRTSNGEVKSVGPHPSTIRVARPYIFQHQIDKLLRGGVQDGLDPNVLGVAEAREDQVRLQGVAWIDNVRRELQLPIKTFATGCVSYHKFRLAHPSGEYNWMDAAAGSLLAACKIEDTLKKSREILAAAYNLRCAPHEQLGADDPLFEAQSRAVIGIERLVIEANGFDFRSRQPHQLSVKIAKKAFKGLGRSDSGKAISDLAWAVITDLYRTFAPIKQTKSAIAIAGLELACRLMDDQAALEEVQKLDLSHGQLSTERQFIMETLLDALDLYTHHTGNTIVGLKYGLDLFLQIRLIYNRECAEKNLPRFTNAPSPKAATTSATSVQNGHPTPVSPPANAPAPTNNGANDAALAGAGTLRFMLNPEMAANEKKTVNDYFKQEYEEYEEEIEIPLEREDRDRSGRDRGERDRREREPRERDRRDERDYHRRDDRRRDERDYRDRR